ncbi:MAG: hypothetical protein EP330_09815 [Deltaproteobacteria bacterium]|nr:MAG: hypothetical protein EP330_09815 [Deltaproteobacteria bacterium]
MDPSLSPLDAMPLDPAWVPWVLDRARERGLEVYAALRCAQGWCPVEPEALAQCETACVHQRPGCRGLVSRVLLRSEGGEAGLWAAPAADGSEPSEWRLLLLEALVLSAAEERLAAR